VPGSAVRAGFAACHSTPGFQGLKRRIDLFNDTTRMLYAISWHIGTQK